MGFNDDLGFASSYYKASAHPAPDYPRLDADVATDLVVVGGGCTGLSAALHAARRGLSVIVLEGGKVGWGASGRNGGQMIPGLRKGGVELVRQLGLQRAKAVFDLSLLARELVLDLIDTCAIDCDLKSTGHLLAASKASDPRWMEAEAKCLSTTFAYPHIDLLSAAQTRAKVDAAYHGGLFDRLGGHLHPLNFTLGLARAATEAGVKVYEHSPAGELSGKGPVQITTAGGRVKARHAVLAGDALLHGLSNRVNSRIMPVANYIAATAPLADPDALIPSNAAVSDSRFVVNYYRRSVDGRLLFGGGERYSRQPPDDIAAFVRPHMQATFPQLKDVAIEHAWGGMVSVTMTRLPHIGRDKEVYFAHGYSGMGVILSVLAGKLLVDAMAADTSGFDLFAQLEPPAFPGGVALRGPLHVLGMLWYALRDRL